MGIDNGKALFAALTGGLLAAVGAAMIITLAMAILGLYLSGHNLSLWGYGRLPDQPIGNWPGVLLVGGSSCTGVVTGMLLYRNFSTK